MSAIGLSAGPGTAHPPGGNVTPHWTCRASVAYAEIAQGQTPVHVEPAVANGNQFDGGDRDECATDHALSRSEPVQLGSDDMGATVQPVYARTDANTTQNGHDNDFAFYQRPAADTQGAQVILRGGDQSLEISSVESHAASDSASCVNGRPVLRTSSSVGAVRANGDNTPIADPGTQSEVLRQGPFTVFFNQRLGPTAVGQPAYGEQVYQRAISARIELADGRTMDVVIGETRIGYHGDVCTPPPARCPAGTTFNGEVCVIIRVVETPGPCPAGTTREGNDCIRTIVVGVPNRELGKGGQTVPIDEVDGIGRGHPCRAPRFGRQVAIVGTRRADRITGSNRSDRMFVFQGNDRVSGGRGNDCIDGGVGSDRLEGSTGTDYLLGAAGNDNLSGAQNGDHLYGGSGNDKIGGGSGSDRLYGGRGIDKLSGGTGNDRITGGPGRDYIDGGQGRDRINAGGGDDAINVSTAGPAAVIDCGPGSDLVRLNHNEIARTRNCERVFVITRLNRLRRFEAR